MNASKSAVEAAEAPLARAVEPVPWYRRWTLGKNLYDRTELAGAFGDLGTLIPFVPSAPRTTSSSRTGR